MRRITVCAIVVAMTVCGLAQEANVRVTVEGAVLVKGQAYKQTVDGKMVSKQPSWDPLKEKCPLDPSKAVQLGIEKLMAGIPSATQLKLASVSLNQVPSMTNKWYYIVTFFEKPDSSDGDSANVIVCLDGTVPPFVNEK